MVKRDSLMLPPYVQSQVLLISPYMNQTCHSFEFTCVLAQSISIFLIWTDKYFLLYLLHYTCFKAIQQQYQQNPKKQMTTCLSADSLLPLMMAHYFSYTIFSYIE